MMQFDLGLKDFTTQYSVTISDWNFEYACWNYRSFVKLNPSRVSYQFLFRSQCIFWNRKHSLRRGTRGRWQSSILWKSVPFTL